GACVANYVEAVGFEGGGELRAVRAVDRAGGRELLIRARQFLNATGPWVDRVCELAGDHSGPHLPPTKGVHLVLPDQGLSSARLRRHPADGRVFFVIPGLGKTLLAPTDTLCDRPPEALTVTAEETDYLLAGYNHHFATPLRHAQVLGAFAGLRPLLRSRPGE